MVRVQLEILSNHWTLFYLRTVISLSADIGEMVNNMKAEQHLFSTTGGVHAAALFNQNGDLLVVREDIGRHNAFDKAIGASIRNHFDSKIVVMSSRIGWELVAKGVRSGVELIIAVGAISFCSRGFGKVKWYDIGWICI